MKTWKNHGNVMEFCWSAAVESLRQSFLLISIQFSSKVNTWRVLNFCKLSCGVRCVANHCVLRKLCFENENYRFLHYHPNPLCAKPGSCPCYHPHPSAKTWKAGLFRFPAFWPKELPVFPTCWVSWFPTFRIFDFLGFHEDDPNAGNSAYVVSRLEIRTPIVLIVDTDDYPDICMWRSGSIGIPLVTFWVSDFPKFPLFRISDQGSHCTWKA